MRGFDHHGRPVVVGDSSRENTWDADGNMNLLAFTLERAIRLMKPPVDKYVLIIRLGDTSPYNFSKKTDYLVGKILCRKNFSSVPPDHKPKLNPSSGRAVLSM